MAEHNAYWANSDGLNMEFVDHGPFATVEDAKDKALAYSLVDPDDMLVIFELNDGVDKCVGIAYQGDWFVKED